MNILLSGKVNYITIVIVSMLAGLLTYSILSYMFVDNKITIPASIVLSLLVLGLTKYYSKSSLSFIKNGERSLPSEARQKDRLIKYDKRRTGNFSSCLFIGIFAMAILISYFALEQNLHIFTSWNKIGVGGLIQLGASIILCFFLPGYALVLILAQKYKIDPILKTILAYLLSILITGLTAYIAGLYFDKAVAEIKYLFIVVYLSIFLSFLVYYPWRRIDFRQNKIKKFIQYRTTVTIVADFLRFLKVFSSELLVFTSIFALLIIGTYYVYGGGTIGDQWYHQGRALLFMSGSFREAALSGEETFYPPLQSAFLAAVASLSGIPLVNAYASIAFLNMVPIFAFYYFFQTWVPTFMKRAGLLACSMYAIGSGLGWIYLLHTVTINPILSPHSSLETLSKIGPIDIVSTSNFVFTTAPQFSTALTYIVLPAGFALLGVLRRGFDVTLVNVLVITALSLLGILVHDEFFIFIIIAGILPIIFKMENRSYIYISFISAFLISYLIEIITPGDFLSSHEILGVPLLLLMISFVLLTWIIYLIREHIHKFLKSAFRFLNKCLSSLHKNERFMFLEKVLIVSIVTYVYLLTFIVLSQLPVTAIAEQARDNTIPWYLYPMRFGVAGILGLAFILSLLFRKFEKHILIFGVFIVIPFIIGPYYDEHRFMKYMMVGIIGFASLMIYTLLNQKFNNNPVAKTVVLGIIITSSSLSVLLYIGYNSLIYQTQDYTDTLARRHFPSISDLYLFELLHNRTNVDSTKHNVLSFLNQYDRLEDGVMAKVPAFSGLPYDKIRQSPLTLNASTPDALYHLLAYSDVRYILLPNYSIQDKVIVTEPVSFLLGHFKRIYINNNYILLEVPTMAPPAFSSKAVVALAYNETDNLISKQISDIDLLLFDNKTFHFTSDNKLVNVQKENLTQVLNLLGEKLDRGITVWSKNISQEKKVNYIESSFKIASENENKSNDVRIEWQEPGERSYYVKLSNAGLELYQKSKDDPDKRILLKSAQIDKENGTWNNIKIERLDDLINIYWNNLLKMQVPSDNHSRTQGISKVGLTAYYNDVVFKPLEIGTVSDYSHDSHERIKYYNYYYPLSLLALSKSNYDTFSNSDPSAFTKGVMVVPDSLLLDDARLKQYLDYVHAGGKLIIINSQVEFSAILNKLFNLNITGGEEGSFTNIGKDRDHKVMINVSGNVKMINTTSLSDIHTIATYRNNKNDSLAPFIIEKSFSGRGKIYLLNARAYFDSISNSPTQYFLTLSNASKLLPVDLGQGTIFQNTSIPSKGFIGKMQISGKVTFNSSSLTSLIPFDYNEPYLINTSRISIFKSGTDVPIVLNNVSIKDLKVTGDHEAMIDIMGTLELPDVRSNRDYFGIQIPTGSNIVLKLSPNALGNMEIITQNESSVKSMSFSNDSRVEMYYVKAPPPWKLLPILIKEPKMSVDGSTRIKHTYLSGFINERGRLDSGPPVDFQGNLETKLELVDNFDQPYRNTTSSTSVTYLQTLVVDGAFSQDRDDPKLPGDIYFAAKQREKEIPLEKILTSPSNIITVISLITVTVIVSKIIWRRKFS